MTDRTEQARLYERAAGCFERVGYLGRAAACREAAGLPAAAAELYERAGNAESAARCYRRAGRTADAVRCYHALRRPEDAAACWEDAGDLLQAAFVLALESRSIRQASWLATEARPQTDGRRLCREIVLALCRDRQSRGTDQLEDALVDAEELLPGLRPTDRVRAADWAVRAADAVGRHDLAARILAADYRARTPGAAARWRAWALRRLGGTSGLPGHPARASESPG